MKTAPTCIALFVAMLGRGCDTGSVDSQTCATDGSSSSADRAAGVSLPDIIARTMPSVVTISALRLVARARPGTTVSAPSGDRFGGPQVLVERISGSGVVLEDNAVVTNSHVVAGAYRITVTVAGGRRLPAAIVGADAEIDLAVLRLDGSPGRLSPLKWGDSDRLRVGELVVAIGNPFGLGESVSSGIVSGKDRSNLGVLGREHFIQVDASINPGDSGGALINLRGELVGINTAILVSHPHSARIGFAIPSRLAKSVVDGLLSR